MAGYDPKLALVGAIGLAFVMLVISNLTFGLYVFAVATFLESMSLGSGLTFSKALGLLLALSWLGHVAVRGGKAKDFVTDHPVFSFVLLAFITWGALTLVWAEDPSEGLQSLYRYALNALLFFIVYTAIRTRKQAVWLVGAFLIGAVLSAAYGVMSPPAADPVDAGRLGGAGVNANELAALLVAAVSLAIAFAAGWRRSPLVRVLASLVIAFCAAAIVMSFSRGGFIALTVALLVGLVLAGRWRAPMLGLAAVVVVMSLGYFTLFATGEQIDRLTTPDGGAGRVDIWSVGWRMVKENPIGGMGAGNFTVSSVRFLVEPGAIQADQYIVDEPQVAHNMYLQLWSEEGIVGLALFLGILGFGVYTALKAAREYRRKGDEHLELLSRSVAVALIALLAADFFGSFQFTKQLWLLLALGPVLLRLAVQGDEDTVEEPQAPVLDMRPARWTPASA
jgi:O-antigen ligase